jgi:hypothetical protein
MINLIIAYDDNDVELGGYFEESFNHTNEVVVLLNFITLNSIRGLDCTEQNINSAVIPLNKESFIFASFSHGSGSGDCLLTTNDVFVGDSNVSHFCNSFFYTTACCVATQLAGNLLKSNCFCFVGYADASWATYEDFYDIYIACENYALNEFLRTTKTIQETFNEMNSYFDEQIKLLYDANEILVAMELEHNRDCFKLLGNGSLTSSDFQI